ncbi:MAG: sugar phosphate isomerase/epimerase family protein [bacterium]|nr:sugar phosphate isomerase/epimerase family protein [bacterium]
MDYGMPFLIETETQQKCIELCRQLGLQFIEWNMNFPQCQLSQLNPDYLNQVRVKDGIYFTIHLDENLNISDFNTRVTEAYLATVRETIALAKKIEAPIINMHLAKGIFITLPDKKRYLFEEYRDFYMQNMRHFRDICEREIGDSGVRISLENTGGFQPYEQEAIELLLERQCFGLTLDIGHSYVVGDCDLPFYDRHGDRLLHMHAHDANATHNHLAFGDGELNLESALMRARKAGARVVLETKTIEALTKTVAYLRDKRL